MEEDRFNPETYAVIDRITGEEVPIQIFIEMSGREYWEKTYSKVLADYIGIGGNAACRILAFIIKEKNSSNLVLSTIREASKKSKADGKTVQRVFNALYEKKLMRKIRSGCYFVSPNLLRHGSKTQGAMLLRLWNVDETKEE